MMNHHAAAILHFAYSITACTALRVCRRALATTAAALPEAKDLARQTETRISLPDATWTCGVQQPAPFKRQMWKQFDPDSAEKFSRYSLLISCAVPRPIALVTSLDTNGVRNCAPFSYFGVVSHDPPLLSVTVCTQGRDRTQKDTLNNITATNQFVVNIMSEWFVESANHTCGAFPPDVDEITVSGLSAVPSVKVKPPRVAESAVQLECQVYNIQPIYNDAQEHTSSIVYGRIVNFHVHEEVLSESGLTADINKLKPISRAGGDTYVTVGQTFDLKRPKVF